MQLTYSVTVNVSPFKKIKDVDGEVVQFTKLDHSRQKIVIFDIVMKLATITGGEYAAYVWESTKRGDLHYHGTFQVDAPLTETDMQCIRKLSNEYGNDYYNKAIDVQYCRDGGQHWRNVYMQKQQPRPTTPDVINVNVFKKPPNEP